MSIQPKRKYKKANNNTSTNKRQQTSQENQKQNNQNNTTSSSIQNNQEVNYNQNTTAIKNSYLDQLRARANETQALILCTICQEIAKDAVYAPCRSHMYCFKCWTDYVLSLPRAFTADGKDFKPLQVECPQCKATETLTRWNKLVSISNFVPTNLYQHIFNLTSAILITDPTKQTQNNTVKIEIDIETQPIINHPIINQPLILSPSKIQPLILSPSKIQTNGEWCDGEWREQIDTKIEKEMVIIRAKIKEAKQEHNDKKALPWLLQAYKRGCAYSCNSIGIMFQNGFYVQKNFKIAAGWYRRGRNVYCNEEALENLVDIGAITENEEIDYDEFEGIPTEAHTEINQIDKYCTQTESERKLESEANKELDSEVNNELESERKLDIQEIENCPFQQCESNLKDIASTTLRQQHLLKCFYAQITCPNHGCKEIIKINNQGYKYAKEIYAHAQQCKFFECTHCQGTGYTWGQIQQHRSATQAATRPNTLNRFFTPAEANLHQAVAELFSYPRFVHTAPQTLENLQTLVVRLTEQAEIAATHQMDSRDVLDLTFILPQQNALQNEQQNAQQPQGNQNRAPLNRHPAHHNEIIQLSDDEDQPMADEQE